MGYNTTMSAKAEETMLHPFTNVACGVTHLNPGDAVDPGDLYRSATVDVKGFPIDAMKPGIGRWFVAGDLLDGCIIGVDCNVHFVRLTPLEG